VGELIHHATILLQDVNHPRKKYGHPEQKGCGVLSAERYPARTSIKRTMHVVTSCC
jgi:hypothetical protein